MFNSYNNKPENSLNFHNKWKKNYLWVQQKTENSTTWQYFFAFNQIFHSCCKKFNNREILRASNVSEREREFHSKWIISASFISLNERVCVCVCLPSCSQLLRFLIRRFAWACVGVKFLPFFLQNTANERVFYALSHVVVSNSLLALSLFLCSIHMQRCRCDWL